MTTNGSRIPWVWRWRTEGAPRTEVVPGTEETAKARARPKRRTRRRLTERMLAVMLGLAVVILPVLALTGFTTWYLQDQKIPREVTQTYWYDQQNERWMDVVQEKKVTQNSDGSLPSGSHTVIIRVSENNPVKQIIIQEALVINPSSSDPLLEIGNSDNFSGKINIGTLKFNTVDAKRLEIDADIVRVNMENVVAKDDELHLDLNVVNVVRTARGAASSLSLGVSRAVGLSRVGLGIDPADAEAISIGSRETGMRVDRIRILGPNSGTGFIETLLIERSSVLGKIDVRNVSVQDLILRAISLDDS